jgi:hypothetical protein
LALFELQKGRLLSVLGRNDIKPGDPVLIFFERKPPAVVIQEKNDVQFGKTLTLPPISVSLYEVAVR